MAGAHEVTSAPRAWHGLGRFWGSLGLRARLALGATMLAITFSLVTGFGLVVLTGRFSARQVAEEVQDARDSFRLQMDLRRRSLRRETREFARSPVLLATAAIPGVDEATFADVLQEMASPVVAVLDPSGRVVASRGAWRPGTVPGDADAVRGLAGETTDHVWTHDGAPVLVAVAPLVQGDELLGALVRGQRVDDDLARQIGEQASRDVLLVHEGRLLGRHWEGGLPDRTVPDRLARLTRVQLPPEGVTLDLDVGGRLRFGLAVRLHEDLGIAFLSHDLHQVEALRDEARTWLAVWGTVFAAVCALLARHTAARLTRPLDALTAAADHMGRGRLATRVDTDGMDPEIGALARSFNAMAATVESLVADVTDKAARAEAANRAKDGFLTSISHELRTPLTGIQSTAELLQQFGDDASSEDRAQFLATILEQAERLGSRITDALEYASLVSGTAQWAIGPVRLRQVCEEACRRLATLQELKPVPVSILAPEDPVLSGDRERITQAVQQLLRNAWQWSPASTVIEVAIRGDDVGYAIDVSDRGPGVSSSDRERIFDRFSQGGDVLVDKPSGIGIGLKIAAEVAAAHGGSVDHSPREGGGSTFHLVLRSVERPVALVAAAPPPAWPAADPGGHEPPASGS